MGKKQTLALDPQRCIDYFEGQRKVADAKHKSLIDISPQEMPSEQALELVMRIGVAIGREQAFGEAIEIFQGAKVAIADG